MPTPDPRAAVVAALAEIAPEVDLDEVDATVPFAEEVDLDSMDLLSLSAALFEATGVDVDDGRLPSPWSLGDLLAALAAG